MRARKLGGKLARLVVVVGVAFGATVAGLTAAAAVDLQPAQQELPQPDGFEWD
jgi:hypothetical protein